VENDLPYSDFFAEFDHNVCVPPPGCGVVCDPNYYAGDFKLAIDYMGDVLGHDLYPDGCSSWDPTADLVPCPASTTFLHGPTIQVYLEKRNGEKDIFPDETSPLTERSIAELSLYGKDHAMEIVGYSKSLGQQYPDYNLFKVGEAPPADGYAANAPPSCTSPTDDHHISTFPTDTHPSNTSATDAPPSITSPTDAHPSSTSPTDDHSGGNPSTNAQLYSADA